MRTIIVAALTLAFSSWRSEAFGDRVSEWLLDMEGHGREEFSGQIDLARTVGWFTAIFPVRLECPVRARHDGPSYELIAALEATRQALETTPLAGLSYGVLRYMSEPGQVALGPYQTGAVCLNYLGRQARSHELGQPWRRVPETVPPKPRDDLMRVAHGLEIIVALEDGSDGPDIVADWLYSPEYIAEPDVTEMVANWHEHIGKLAEALLA